MHEHLEITVTHLQLDYVYSHLMYILAIVHGCFVNSDHTVSLAMFSPTGCKQWGESTQTCMNKVYTLLQSICLPTHTPMGSL